MKKYYVIAIKWSEEHKKQIKYIAGEFSDYTNANIFRKAYDSTYSTESHIFDDDMLLNN